METAGLVFLLWAVHAVFGAGLSAPILFWGRKHAPVAKWQGLALVLPYLVWLLLMLSPLSTGRKSLANLGEPICISFAMPMAALARVALGRHLPERACAVSLLTALCVEAGVVFFAVPPLPE